MDRNKLGGSRGPKPKIGAPHMGSELFALGTKSTTSRDDKNKVMSAVKGVSDRKREPSTSLGNVAKKPKLSGSIGNVPRLSGEGSSSSSSVMEPWEQLAIECEPVDLVETVYTALDQQDSDSVVSYVCGAIKLLSSQRTKNDNVLTLALLYLAKLRPSLFCNDIVTSALISILKRDSQHAFKTRSHPLAHIVACNLLARGYHDKKHWPEMFLKTYIDDAANERVWADNEYCAPFVENICLAFKTRVPPKNMLQPEFTGLLAQRDATISIDDDSNDNSMQGDSLKGCDLKLDCALQNRYATSGHIVEKYVMDAIKEQLNKRQQQDCYTRNFLKFLCTTSGFGEVRSLCITRLELWIHNGKLMKPAQELLTYICFNITGQTVKDHEVLATLVKMRLKTKPLINVYMMCLKEMIQLQPDILPIALKYVVQNELSNARNPNNMGMLAAMFQTKPDQSARHLAEIYKEFLMQREDCLRTLRVFLRELVRTLRYDINIVEFCKAFLTSRPDLIPLIQQSEYKDRIFHSMVDLTCLCMLLTVSPQVREANVSLRNGRDMKSNPILLNFYAQMSQIQLDALSWMYESVQVIFKLPGLDYSQALHKILLLESPEQYSKCDQWPPEPERVTLLRMVSETPIHEDSLLRIILIGITKEIPFTIPDTIEVIVLAIKRASALRSMDCPAVEANKFDIIDFLFSMAEYHHPEKIKLPENYEPPKLAITVLYWKAWIIMLMISAHNPSTFGAFCWEHYPTMKMLMEMCITNQLNETVVAKEELQLLTLERDQIIEFETHLAAQTSQAIITEENAILISQVMLMDPMGPARRVPPAVLEQLRHLNKTLKLGHLLCRSRKPDLLLDIIQRQGTTQSMPWLSDLVQNSEGDFNHLPVQCLCEFLLSNAATISEDNSRDAELLNYLRQLVKDPNSEKQTVCEVLDYIFRRLASTVKQSRVAALSGIKMILKVFNTTEEEEDWLLCSLPQVPHFIHARASIIPQLRAACQIENNPELLMVYIQFIAAHTLHDPVTDMLDHVMDMAQLIVERSTMFQHIIPIQPDSPLAGKVSDALDECRLQTLNCIFVMFNNYIIKLREHREPYEWTEYPDLLMVHFDDGAQLPLHLNIIHAFVILLTHSSITLPDSIPILDYWFPQGRPVPQAYLPETNEAVQLLPDWLKLKMIRSPVETLVEAAMYDLTPDQIVLFVQNFGTPISSMSKLLALLDRAVIEQFDAVKNAILNKAYLAQLIEIQQARGAKNGHITVQALELHSHSQTVPDPPKTLVNTMESVNLDQFQVIAPIPEKASSSSSSKSSKEIEEIVEMVLRAPNLTKLNTYRFRKLIHQLLERDGATPKAKRDMQIHASNKALVHLMRLVESPRGPCFFQNIFQKSHACTFFRALLTYIPAQLQDYDFMLHVIDKIIHNLSLQPNLNNATLLQILQVKKKSFAKKIHAAPEQKYTEKENFLQLLHTASVTELETEGRKFVNDMIDCKKTTHLVDGIITILQCLPQSSDLTTIGYDRRGILVDWLSEVDAELITADKELQIEVMFSKNRDDFRFYLLSLLCHQVNWETLYDTVSYLLEKYRENFDCNSVLNFIEALINNPKLWQGRDRAVSKHDQVEIILQLDFAEEKVFTEYMLQEGVREMELLGPDAYAEKLSSRMNLLMKVIGEPRYNHLQALIEFVTEYPCPEGLKLKFIQQMYLMNPPIKFFQDNERHDVYNSNLQDLKGCKADKVTNYLITCLGNLQTKKDFDALSSETELLLRKLAASHPTLFLRQLGVLSSLLHGKAHMSLRVLRDEHHIQRFIQVIRILELLQPILFDDAYKSGLQSALECYFTFFKHHSRAKEAYHILVKLVELLQAYINTNPSSALSFIEQYTGILQELAAKNSHLVHLHQLVQGLSLLKHKPSGNELKEDELKQEFDLEDSSDVKPQVSALEITEEPTTSGAPQASQLDIESRGAASFALSGTQSRQLQISPHFMNLINIVRHSSVEETILGPLQEIESLTSKRYSLLSELFDRLLELISSHSAQIRSNAYILLIRHLKHHPGRPGVNRCAVNAYIQCLRDDNSTVASTAVDNLVEMTVLLQEYAKEILRVAFSLGITSRLNTCTQIKKAISTLKLQHGC